MNNPNIHTGHRARLREEFAEQGVKNFSDVRALELLLFYSIDRVDTNPLAHRLLDKFGSLHNIFSASYQELIATDGVGPQTAALLKLVPEIYIKGEREHISKKIVSITNSVQAAKHLQTVFANERNEKFVMLSLNPMKELIRTDEVSSGIVNRVSVDIRRIVEIALTNKASFIIISHNHPDGNVRPSSEDINLTSKIFDALGTIGIALSDHIIVSSEEYYSFLDNGIL